MKEWFSPVYSQERFRVFSQKIIDSHPNNKYTTAQLPLETFTEYVEPRRANGCSRR